MDEFLELLVHVDFRVVHDDNRPRKRPGVEERGDLGGEHVMKSRPRERTVGMAPREEAIHVDCGEHGEALTTRGRQLHHGWCSALGPGILAENTPNS